MSISAAHCSSHEKNTQHAAHYFYGSFKAACNIWLFSQLKSSMKAGFICASGFNLVASATRDGRRLIAVVLGAPSSQVRTVKAAQMLERGFNTIDCRG